MSNLRSGVLCIIPARAGSKRLPGKNLRQFCGKPLLQWTVEQACRIREIDKVVVTTDYDPLTLLKSGCKPTETTRKVHFFARGESAATDETPMAQAICEVLAKWTPWPSLVVLLQPTSPTRTDETVRRCLEGTRYWGTEFTTDETGKPNGACYIFPPHRLPPLRREEGFVRAGTDWGQNGYPTDDIDINTLEDFEAAEAVMKARLSK